MSTSNYYTVFALMIATGLAVLLAYFTEIGTYLNFREIRSDCTSKHLQATLLMVVQNACIFMFPFACRIEWWLVPMSFAMFLFVYDELRKHIVRMFPNSKPCILWYFSLARISNLSWTNSFLFSMHWYCVMMSCFFCCFRFSGEDVNILNI